VDTADGFERKERKKDSKKERKGSLFETDNVAEDGFALHVVDNPAFGVIGTVFIQPLTKIYVHTR
jgi:hypothetical protein